MQSTCSSMSERPKDLQHQCLMNSTRYALSQAAEAVQHPRQNSRLGGPQLWGFNASSFRRWLLVDGCVHSIVHSIVVQNL